ncbi:hypothetical protein [Methanobrevibacter sp.]|uniref:hypothetical protein n=1 Tax=Methanobrevibacter sp. TaxID=66852 RepID=UPI0025F93F9F|nr:hypothetical protein [Methanobrevibacter sp.]MBQ2665343.1 hypothetical protein [Methanobrevibacter sp.]
MLDDKGSFYIFDAILAIVLLLIAFLVFNTAISIPTTDYSYETMDIRTAQDVMELLGGKIDFNDETFLGKISKILEDGENSKESISEVSGISKDKLDSYEIKNYRFTENNVLDGEVLASSGDFKKAKDVNVASRTYDGYSYTLAIWQ